MTIGELREYITRVCREEGVNWYLAPRDVLATDPTGCHDLHAFDSNGQRVGQVSDITGPDLEIVDEDLLHQIADLRDLCGVTKSFLLRSSIGRPDLQMHVFKARQSEWQTAGKALFLNNAGSRRAAIA